MGVGIDESGGDCFVIGLRINNSLDFFFLEECINFSS